MIGRAFARLGLAARIGAAIVAAVIAIQVLVTLVFVLNPPSLHPFYSARWLSGAVAEVIKNTMAGAAPSATALGNLQNAELARHWFGACATAPSLSCRPAVAPEQGAGDGSERS